MAKKNIWINAGETSGDLHGGKLIAAMKSLDPSLSFIGMGGPDMRDQGLEAILRVEELSVMGFTEVLGHLPKILSMLGRIKTELATRRPDAVVLIDAPEFNFRVARFAKHLGIPVYYYISPKLWAWRTGRAEFIKKYVDRMISILPFEIDFYKQFDIDVDYVGNPLVDTVDWTSIDHISPEPTRIGLLPGSRRKEIEPLMPEFSRCADILHKRNPTLEFHCVHAPNVAPENLQALWTSKAPLSIHDPKSRYAFMRSCNLLIAASGTVTLESALIGTPTIVTYKVSRLSAAIAKRVIKIPFVSLPNLIMQREVFPELLQDNADGETIAQQALEWLETDGKLNSIRDDLATLRTMLGAPGAPLRAAEIILST